MLGYSFIVIYSNWKFISLLQVTNFEMCVFFKCKDGLQPNVAILVMWKTACGISGEMRAQGLSCILCSHVEYRYVCDFSQ